MKRKIFISINLPSKDKKRLIRATEKWQDLPVKWIKEPNLHITLTFLGFVSDELLLIICEKVKEVSERQEIFDIYFNSISLVPSEKDPRMISLVGEADENLKNLVNEIESVLGLPAGKITFRPHVTLGRLRAHKWTELENKPDIKVKFPMVITAESVDVMASEFEGDGQEYTVIESCPLK